MRLILCFFALATLISACQTSSTTVDESIDSSSVIKKEASGTMTYEGKQYSKYDPSQSWSDFIANNYPKEPNSESMPHRIAIEGKIATAIHQHMMKGNFDSNEEHVYIDILKGEGQQIVGYYNPSMISNIPKNAKKHYFLGTLHSISGAGKGGGTHTEWYIDLDRIGM